MQHPFGDLGLRFARPAWRLGLIIGALWGTALCPLAASANPITFSYTGSIVDYTVPTTGVYDITTAGAQGGSERFNTGTTIIGAPGGLGAMIGGEYLLAAGDVLQILVGSRGVDAFVVSGSGFQGEGAPGGGGGGSFIAMASNTSTLPVPLVVAGGGGGGCGLTGIGGGGLITSNGGNGYVPMSNDNGGTGGNGGGYDEYDSIGDLVAFDGGGGGGYYTNGASVLPIFGGGGGGASFLNRGGGGTSGSNGGAAGGFGGFGGGGGGGGYGAGGGGGYSGGGDGCAAGGGGSYLDPLAINPVLIAATNPGDGYVTLDLLRRVRVPEPASLALFATDLLGFAAFILTAAATGPES